MSDKTQKSLSIAEEFSYKIKLEKRKSKISKIVPVIVLAVLVLFFGLINVEFLSITNVLTILKQLSIPLILALGLTFVIIIGSIDLSVEGVMALTGCLASIIIMNNKTAVDTGFFGILIVVLVGALTGMVTGLIHVRAKLPSFMVSFGISSIASGFALLCYRGIPATIKHPIFISLNKDVFLGIPLITWIAAFVFIVAYILQEYSAFGRYIYAIGDNESIPAQTGIRVKRIKVLVFVWSGFCIGIAGVIALARSGRGDLLIGKGNLFDAITAVVLGGTVLSGGKGGVFNTLLGAVIVTVIQNGLILMDVNPYIQAGIQGIIIVSAVALSVSRRKKLIVK